MKGTPNAATREIRSLAQGYGPAIVNRLAMMAGLAVDALGHSIKGAENETLQLAAMKELLDRGYGRATTIVSADEATMPASIEFCWQDAATSPATAARDGLTTATADQVARQNSAGGPTENEADVALPPAGVARH